MNKVLISTRRVYHKMAAIEIEIPSNLSETEVRQWLDDNEHLYAEKLDDKVANAELYEGLGVEVNGFNEIDADQEHRYQVITKEHGIIFGGHL